MDKFSNRATGDADKMNEESIRDSGSLTKLIIADVDDGGRICRPGDLRPAKAIISRKLWTEIERYGMERVAGKLFADIADELGFRFVRNDTNKARLYELK